jgi:hypothetical protein
VSECDCVLASLPTDVTLIKDTEGCTSHVLHWAGEGSFEQSVLIHNRATSFMGDIVWSGRCCGIPVYPLPRRRTETFPPSYEPMVAFGLHAKPCEDIAVVLCHLCFILPKLPSCVRVFITGDWNLDVGAQPPHPILPSNSVRFIQPSRALVLDNSLSIEAFMHSKNLVIKKPSVMVEAQQFEEMYRSSSIFTRIPRGDQALAARPSLID